MTKEEGLTLLKENNIDESIGDYLYKYLKDKKDFSKGIEKLLAGKPVQYILGEVEFCGYQIKVNEHVLIPRFETEELVEKTINYLKTHFKNDIDLIDLGTGSGCISIALKKTIPNIMIDAVDISKEALLVAKENALLNKVNINFLQNDFLNNIVKKYDVIISNPPYISKNDNNIEAIVKNNEPPVALYSDTGLECYHKILSKARKNLKEKSLIALEIGHNQKEDLKDIILNYFPQANVIIEKDLQGKDRFIFIMNNF